MKRRAKALCAVLLRFYKVGEITPSDDESYEFPDGAILYRVTADHDGLEVKSYLELRIKYDAEREKEFSTLVRELSSRLDWYSLEYSLTKKFDVDKLVALCQKSDIAIESFDPKMESPVIVSAPGWGAAGRPATVYFENGEQGSSVTIVQPYSGKLEDRFYEKLNPKTIVEFLGPALA